jgi:hypothetical protein
MRLTRVDFVVAPARSSRLGVILLVAGALLGGAAVMDDSGRSEAVAQAQDRLKKARAAYKRVEAAHAPKQKYELAGLSPSGDIGRRLGAPWGDLLDALEHAHNDTVALLAVEPDAERGRLRLSGEAKNLDAVVDYMESLEGKAGITELRLLTQQVKQSDAQRPVEFVLESNWLHRAQHAAGASS